MGNLRNKYTDEEWEDLEEKAKNEEEARKQALKDMKTDHFLEFDDSIKEKPNEQKRPK